MTERLRRSTHSRLSRVRILFRAQLVCITNDSYQGCKSLPWFIDVELGVNSAWGIFLKQPQKLTLNHFILDSSKTVICIFIHFASCTPFANGFY